MTEALGMGKNSYTNWKKDLTDKRKGAKHVNNYKYSQEDREKALLALMLNPDMNPFSNIFGKTSSVMLTDFFSE